MGGHESQISPIPPERYGERFVKFIAGITMSRERAEQARLSQTLESSTGIRWPSGVFEPAIDDPRLGGVNIQRDPYNPAGTDQVMEKAERQAQRSKTMGANEANVPDRSLLAARGSGDVAEAATLPVIGEAAENASLASRRVTPTPSHEDVAEPVLGNANMPKDSIGAVPPPTPPKPDGPIHPKDLLFQSERTSGGPPPTPPKDDGYRGRLNNRDLPLPPVATKVFSASPSRMVDEEIERARAKINAEINGDAS